MKILIAIALTVLSTRSDAAPFRNLGFEEGTTNTSQLSLLPNPVVGPIPQGFGPTADLLPGWRVFKGPNPIPSIAYDMLPRDENGFMSLFDARLGHSQYPTEGRYALLMGGPVGNTEPLALVQMGALLPDTGYLSFASDGHFDVWVNGNPLARLGRERERIVFDISPYAGQTVELQIATGTPMFPNTLSGGFIDDIRLLPIPEPSIWAQLCIGGLIVWLAKRNIGWRK